MLKLQRILAKRLDNNVDNEDNTRLQVNLHEEREKACDELIQLEVAIKEVVDSHDDLKN